MSYPDELRSRGSLRLSDFQFTVQIFLSRPEDCEVTCTYETAMWCLYSRFFCFTENIVDFLAPRRLLRDVTPTPCPDNYPLAHRPEKLGIVKTQVVGIRITSINMVHARRKTAKSDGSDAKSVPTILAVLAVRTTRPLLHLTK